MKPNIFRDLLGFNSYPYGDLATTQPCILEEVPAGVADAQSSP
jgi:hypothetical protein